MEQGFMIDDPDARTWPIVLGILGGLIWIVISMGAVIWAYSLHSSQHPTIQQIEPRTTSESTKEEVESAFQNLINGD